MHSILILSIRFKTTRKERETNPQIHSKLTFSTSSKWGDFNPKLTFISQSYFRYHKTYSFCLWHSSTESMKDFAFLLVIVPNHHSKPPSWKSYKINKFLKAYRSTSRYRGISSSPSSSLLVLGYWVSHLPTSSLTSWCIQLIKAQREEIEVIVDINAFNWQILREITLSKMTYRENMCSTVIQKQ